METEGWGDVRRIFEAALDLSVAQRAAFLDSECLGNAALRREVEALFEQDSSSGTFLEELPISALGALPLAAEGGALPEEIGPYRIVATMNKFTCAVMSLRLAEKKIRPSPPGGLSVEYIPEAV